MPRTAATAHLSSCSLNLLAVAAPYGFLCLGLTLLAFGLEQFGALPAVALAPLMLAGALGQLTAGLLELKKDRPFAAVTLVAFALFWLSLIGMTVLPEAGWGEAPRTLDMISYLVLWAAFSFVLLIGSSGSGRVTQTVLGLMLAFLLLLAAAVAIPQLQPLAAGVGLLAGVAAIYHGTVLYLVETADGRSEAQAATE